METIARAEFQKTCDAVLAGDSVLLIMEAGMGIIEFAQSLYTELLGGKHCGIATYKGSIKNFLKTLAFELSIPTETEEGKAMTVDQLKDELLAQCNEETLLILPEAKRLTTSIRYWLEDMMAAGVTVVCFAPVNPQKDIFLQLLEIDTKSGSVTPYVE